MAWNTPDIPCEKTLRISNLSEGSKLWPKCYPKQRPKYELGLQFLWKLIEISKTEKISGTASICLCSGYKNGFKNESMAWGSTRFSPLHKGVVWNLAKNLLTTSGIFNVHILFLLQDLYKLCFGVTKHNSLTSISSKLTCPIWSLKSNSLMPYLSKAQSTFDCLQPFLEMHAAIFSQPCNFSTDWQAGHAGT